MATDGSRRRPTIDDVALEAGVSRGTVSRVLNGGRWVSPEASAAVTAAIKKSGYRVNAHARGLATAKANSVAFLLTEPQNLLFEDPNFSILMQSCAAALAEHDVSLVLLMAADEAEQRRALDFIGAGHVDGVLLVSSHSTRQAFISSILDLGVPAIACGVPLGFERRMGYVAADDEDGAVRIVEHLVASGRHTIATITGPADTSGGQQRLAGFRAALGAEFDPSLVAVGDYGTASGRRAMTELLASHPDIDAVFAANDRMAAAAIDVIRESGRHVPADIAVAGFDDSPAAVQSAPPITTMRQPFERISSEMVRLLLLRIDGDASAAIIVPTELIIRESSSVNA